MQGGVMGPDTSHTCGMAGGRRCAMHRPGGAWGVHDMMTRELRWCTMAWHGMAWQSLVMSTNTRTRMHWGCTGDALGMHWRCTGGALGLPRPPHLGHAALPPRCLRDTRPAPLRHTAHRPSCSVHAVCAHTGCACRVRMQGAHAGCVLWAPNVTENWTTLTRLKTVRVTKKA